MTKNQIKTLIIGGAGGMGMLFAKTYKEIRNEVIISDRSIEIASNAAKAIGVKAYSTEEGIRYADEIVIAADPINTLNIIKEYKDLFTKDKTVYDISSVKNLRSLNKSIVTELSNLEAITLSIHPMFGPENNFKNENVLLIRTNEYSPIAEYKEEFNKLGAICEEFKDGVEHDRYTAYDLAFNHMMGYLCGLFYKNSGLDQRRLQTESGELFRYNMVYSQFVVSSSFLTFGLIQTENRFVPEILEKLYSSIDEFILSENSPENFRRMIEEMRPLNDENYRKIFSSKDNEEPELDIDDRYMAYDLHFNYMKGIVWGLFYKNSKSDLDMNKFRRITGTSFKYNLAFSEFIIDNCNNSIIEEMRKNKKYASEVIDKFYDCLEEFMLSTKNISYFEKMVEEQKSFYEKYYPDSYPECRRQFVRTIIHLK